MQQSPVVHFERWISPSGMYTHRQSYFLHRIVVVCRLAAPATDPTCPLRPSQVRLLESLKSKQNRILVARTGFGKTRVAQEHIQALLGENRQARTIFLNNQAMLAMQQTSRSLAL